MAKTFKYIVEKDWDFLLRIDVDAYCNVKNLEKYIKTLSKDKDHYIGKVYIFQQVNILAI